tara:strand:+ start:329 stop:949 length:621 start_codon:yes stop_codon:yes gene_type:complete
MTIEIKISKKPIEYKKAINFLEKRLKKVIDKKSDELVWILEHPNTYTAGKIYKKNEILNKKIKIINTNRGGKITWHGPGQLICYFVIDLNKRNKDIRNFIKCLENVIIKSLKDYQINSFPDRKNIGIWIYNKKQTFKVGAIGLRIKKWIAYHGFSLNINNDLTPYKNIIPCGITDRDVTSLKIIKKQNYKNLKEKIIKNFIQILDI